MNSLPTHKREDLPVGIAEDRAMDKPISRFPVPSLGEMPEDLRSRVLAVQERAGFVPNVFLTLAHRPDEFRAFFAYHEDVYKRQPLARR